MTCGCLPTVATATHPVGLCRSSTSRSPPLHLWPAPVSRHNRRVILRSLNVLTDTETRSASVHIKNGRIERIGDYDDTAGGVVDHGDLTIMAGLVDSGVSEFGPLDARGLDEAMAALRKTNRPLIVHAELPGPIDAARAALFGDVRSYRRYLASRPPAAEDEAIALVAEVARRSGT